MLLYECDFCKNKKLDGSKDMRDNNMYVLHTVTNDNIYSNIYRYDGLFICPDCLDKLMDSVHKNSDSEFVRKLKLSVKSIPMTIGDCGERDMIYANGWNDALEAVNQIIDNCVNKTYGEGDLK